MKDHISKIGHRLEEGRVRKVERTWDDLVEKCAYGNSQTGNFKREGNDPNVRYCTEAFPVHEVLFINGSSLCLC